METTAPPAYRERAPSPELAPRVECFWTVRGAHPPGEENVRRILPDGCMDVIFDLCPRPLLPLAPSYVVGTMTRAFPVRSAGEVHVVGVRFRPGAATAFLDLRADELADGRASLDVFWGGDAEEAWERVRREGTSFLDALLRRRLRAADDRDADRARRAAALLASGHPRRGVDDVARAVGLGRRQLERRFRESVGVPPAVLARILRFRRATGLLAAPEPGSLAAVAYVAGYHDQPHMTRDFRAFAGVTPGAYRKSARPPEDASVQDVPSRRG